MHLGFRLPCLDLAILDHVMPDMMEAKKLRQALTPIYIQLHRYIIPT